MKNLQPDYDARTPELPPSVDRRRRDRIALAIPLRILSRGFLKDRCDVGTCRDLSEGGVAFDCDAQLSVGEMVILEFQQKGEASYRCNARLAYRMGRRYGAYFLTGD